MVRDGLAPNLGGCAQKLQAARQRRLEKALTPTEHGRLLKLRDDGREHEHRPSFHAPTRVARHQCPLWADDRQVSVWFYAFSIYLYGNAVLTSNMAGSVPEEPDRQAPARCTSTEDRLVRPLMLPLQPHHLSPEGGLFGLPLRASNEGLLRPRVARAQEANGPPSHSSLDRPTPPWL